MTPKPSPAGRVAAVLAVLAIAVHTAPAAPTDVPSRPWRLGLGLGSPQTLAVTAERELAPGNCLQAHAGSVVLFSSVGARVLVMPPRWRVQPYAFAGGGFLHAMGTDTGEARGLTGFGWWGLGLRTRPGRLVPFVELGRLWGLSEAKGYDPTTEAVAVGLLWAF